MQFNIFGARVTVSFLLIALLAFFAFTDKQGLFLCAFTAALLHEGGHLIAVLACACRVQSLELLPCGIKLKLTRPLSLLPISRQLLILLAGCATNFAVCLILFWGCGRWTTPCTVHLATGLFNMLPSGTLDGGRALEVLLPGCPRLLDVLSMGCAALLFLAGVALLRVSGYNVSLLITAAYLAVTVIVRQKS